MRSHQHLHTLPDHERRNAKGQKLTARNLGNKSVSPIGGGEGDRHALQRWPRRRENIANRRAGSLANRTATMAMAQGVRAGRRVPSATRGQATSASNKRYNNAPRACDNRQRRLPTIATLKRAHLKGPRRTRRGRACAHSEHSQWPCPSAHSQEGCPLTTASRALARHQYVWPRASPYAGNASANGRAC